MGILSDITKTSRDSLFEAAGGRLTHILDRLGFKSGRGRVTEFHSFLTASSPEDFSDLSYSTVKSWFQDSSPPMKKMDAVFRALQRDYPITCDLSLVKTWWKLGGIYPFSDSSGERMLALEELKQEARENEQKLQFLIMSLITEEAGGNFNGFSGKELVEVRDAVTKFAHDFSDPLKTSCPVEYLRKFVQYELSNLVKKAAD